MIHSLPVGRRGIHYWWPADVNVAKVSHLQGNRIQYLQMNQSLAIFITQSSEWSSIIMQCGGAANFRQCYGFGKYWYISSPNTVICPRYHTPPAIHAYSNCKMFLEQCLSTVTLSILLQYICHAYPSQEWGAAKLGFLLLFRGAVAFLELSTWNARTDPHTKINMCPETGAVLKGKSHLPTINFQGIS